VRPCTGAGTSTFHHKPSKISHVNHVEVSKLLFFKKKCSCFDSVYSGALVLCVGAAANTVRCVSLRSIFFVETVRKSDEDLVGGE
jgi:hypothetical protein